MGREIRRVPEGWEHPKKPVPTGNFMSGPIVYEERYLPMHDEDYESVANKWIEETILWSKGEHPDQKEFEGSSKYQFYWEWADNPPEPDVYRPKWTDEECTHYQMYETVTEGTPVSPVFATLEELEKWLVNDYGYSEEAAKAFVGTGWALSFMVEMPSGTLYEGAEALVADKG